MDTSETYIKMSDCPEIQDYKSLDALYGGHYWIDGDYYWLDGLTHGYYSFTMRPTGYYNAIWLPRQDQLQEIMTKGEFAWATLLIEFFDYFKKILIVDGMDVTKMPFNSMEQLWLAFVMKEKYNKMWDSERWVICSQA